eukprot:TRINITY_DN1382_c0_g1_i1.p1 TRINITY_DN1382_c0_g1~~TRINITY_DN1382_c0_g1_i1.p1  ORF type:complete len:287 (-),score=20.70 TRINITY_DN1382_c0_g1_i1:173-1012(-)
MVLHHVSCLVCIFMVMTSPWYARGQSSTCPARFTSPSGYVYDLSPLDVNLSILPPNGAIGNEYYINACNVSQPCYLPAMTSSGGGFPGTIATAGVCVWPRSIPHVFYNLGQAANRTIQPKTGSQEGEVIFLLLCFFHFSNIKSLNCICIIIQGLIIFLMGGYCQSNNNIQSFSTIDLFCDEDASSPTIAYQNVIDCNYRFQLSSRHACPVEQTTTTAGSADLTTTTTTTTTTIASTSATTSTTSTSTGKATNGTSDKQSVISSSWIMFFLTITLLVRLL